MSRIITNYIRMGANFALGLLLVRLLLTMDEGVYAVIVLLGTSVGISGMLKEVVRASMIAEVGLALHSGDEDRFRRTYSTAFVLSLLGAVGAALILTCFYVFLGSFNIAENLVGAAGVFLLWRMAHTFIAVASAPVTNILPITGRMGEMNIWLALERVVEVLAAYYIVHSLKPEDPAEALTLFAVMSTSAMIVVNLAWVASVMRSGRKFIPGLAHFDRSILRTISTTIGWNGFVVAAMNLYGPLMTIVINLAFGAAATVVFGIAYQLLSYIRQAVIGVVFGLDAVFTKLAGDDKAKHRRLLSVTTSLQAMIVLSLSAFVVINIDFIIERWVGDRLTDPGSQIPQIALLFEVLTIGVAARAVSEGWMRYLSGIGEVRSYGPVLLKGAILNPVLMGLAILLFPPETALVLVVAAFTLLMVVVHIGLLPTVVGRFTGQSAMSVLRQLALPALITAAASGLSLTVFTVSDMSPLMQFLVSGGIFAALFVYPFLRKFLQLREKPNGAAKQHGSEHH